MKCGMAVSPVAFYFITGLVGKFGVTGITGLVGNRMSRMLLSWLTDAAISLLLSSAASDVRRCALADSVPEAKMMIAAAARVLVKFFIIVCVLKGFVILVCFVVCLFC